MRMRTDLYFFKSIDWKFDTNYELLIPKIVHNNQPNYPNNVYFNDFIWIGKYAISKYIADLYHTILEYGPTNSPTEYFFAVHMRNRLQTKILHCDFDFELERRTSGFEDCPELRTRRINEGEFI